MDFFSPFITSLQPSALSSFKIQISLTVPLLPLQRLLPSAYRRCFLQSSLDEISVMDRFQLWLQKTPACLFCHGFQYWSECLNLITDMGFSVFASGGRGGDRGREVEFCKCFTRRLRSFDIKNTW